MASFPVFIGERYLELKERNMDDKRIIELFFNRSEDAIISLGEKYGAYCHSVAYGILRDEGDSEECVNDSYLKLWNAIPPQEPQDLKAFAARTVRNTAIDMLDKRSAQKRSGAEVALDELSEILPANEPDMQTQLALSDAIGRFVGTLHIDARRMFLCRYWYFMSVEEIAQKWKVSQSKVKMSLLRSRQKMKKHLEREGFTL